MQRRGSRTSRRFWRETSKMGISLWDTCDEDDDDDDQSQLLEGNNKEFA